MSAAYGKEHLGSLLVRAGVLKESDLKAALDEAQSDNRRLGDVLIARGLTTEDQIQHFLSIQLGYPTIDLDRTWIDPEVAHALPEKFARRYGVLPLYRADASGGQAVVVAMTDPTDIVVQDEIRNALGQEIFVVMCLPRSAMDRHLDRLWLSAPVVVEEPASAAVTESAPPLLPLGGEELKPSVARLLETLFKQALDLRASSVHLEPKQKFVSVRYRIDGQYTNVTSLPRDLYQAVLTRLKILGKLTVGEAVQVLEEGRFHLRPDLVAPPIDIRVSIVPALFGEKVVLRITRRSEIIRPLADLGFEAGQTRELDELLAAPAGLILVAGKNDSGKTTTAYSCLSVMGGPSTMIVTIEDPPAYPVSSFNQLRKVHLPETPETAAWDMTVKAVERQEPNLVYMSSVETRDEVKMMLRLAATGRRVLATLFADDAVSAHWVALQLGADSFAIGSVLAGVINARLVRLLCPHCRRPAQAPPPDAVLARLELTRDWLKGKTLYAAVGCELCGGHGYLGRTGVFEVLTVKEHLREMVESKVPSDLMRRAAIEAGMMPLREAGLAKVLRGETTIEELASRI